MSKTYQEQLALCKCETEAYSNIWKSNVWTITDYEELFEDINRGYVIQDPDNNYFILNPDWEGEEDSEDEEEIPKPFDEYAGDNNWIMCFHAKYEDVIWNYYSKKDYWLKQNTENYFLLIKDGRLCEDNGDGGSWCL